MTKYLDAKEKELIKSIESDNGWKLADNQKELKKEMMQAALKYQKKSTRITINIDMTDIEKVKILAEKEGLPYQTFLRSMIHKLVSSRFGG